MENLPHVIGKVGLFLEIIGTILLASSLAGPERVEWWEWRLRFFYKRALSGAYYFDLYERVIPVVLWFIIIVSWVLILGVVCWRGVDMLPELTSWLLSRSKTIIIGACCLSILLLWPIVSILFWGLDIMWRIVLWLSYLPVLLLSLAFATGLYIITVTLLIPYILADSLSNSFNLRPALGVCGTLIILSGLIMQFWQ